MSKPLDDSWQRFPEARIRMREAGLKTILEGLGEDGYCIGCAPRIHLIDEEGVYVDIMLNAGKHGSVVALPLEIFIPAKMLTAPSKKKKAPKENKAIEVEPVEVEPIDPPPVADPAAPITDEN